jgi:Pyruvate phosphate dikinase, AMP/ATP-binding domain
MNDLPLTSILPPENGGFTGFGHLMPNRVQEVLLVASMYDAFTLEEGGRLTELLLSEYRELNLSFPPHVTRASTGGEALELLRARGFDLVITMSRLGDMMATEMAGLIKADFPALTVYTLAFNPRELAFLQEADGAQHIDRFFLWSGDAHLLLALIKFCEDSMNLAHDTRYGDVRCILLIEDSVRFYSLYLPLLYVEILEQTQSLMDDGINLTHRLLRLRARPKILLAHTFEEAWELYDKYKDSLLGVISDGRFPWKGVAREDAGVEFIRRVKYVDPNTPAVLQSSNQDNESRANLVGAGFIQKNSPHLLSELRRFMLANFGFGSFIFRLPDGTEIGRAANLKELIRMLRTVPDESVRHHASNDHFSNWMRARTEFPLAARIRPRKVTEFSSDEKLRAFLLETITLFRDERTRGAIADFSRGQFDEGSRFVRIGGGSLGGKGRGLAFMNSILHKYQVTNRFPGVSVQVPPTAVVASDVFDTFMSSNGLLDKVTGDVSDDEVIRLFLETKLPPEIYGDLEAFLEQIRYPLAVRSSSLLEDSQFQPFAGVYRTYMLANNHENLKVRLDQLCDGIKLVYASAYSQAAKSYIEATGNRIEEEKMSVILQQMVGRRYDSYDYPHFSGVGHSSNFYPAYGMKPEEGVVTVALGLGRTVAEGGKALRFSPFHPEVLPQFGTIDEWLQNSQSKFFAVDISDSETYPGADDGFNLALLDLADSERHGTLEPLGSVYSAENSVIYDGIHRPGARLVSFAHILKGDLFPLAEILKLLLELGRRTMSAEVEIEFAVVLGDGKRTDHQFGFLQIRPLAADFDAPEVSEEILNDPESLIATNLALGNGRISGIRDILYVPPELFDRGQTLEIAEEISLLNREYVKSATPYLLMGPGRWGSADRWLGIPVRWDQISGARVIVETDLDDFKVTPSQGSHFFQNLTSFQVGYLTVNTTTGQSRLDWDWFAQQKPAYQGKYVRKIQLKEPISVLIDGRNRHGVVLKPGSRQD